jgi:hypothetical protein
MLYAYSRKLLEEVTSHCSADVNASVRIRATFKVIYIAKVRLLLRRGSFFSPAGGVRDSKRKKLDLNYPSPLFLKTTTFILTVL